MQEFEFQGRVLVPAKSGARFLRLFLKIVIGVMLALMLLKVLMDDFSLPRLLPIVIGAGILFRYFRRRENQSHVELVPVYATISDETLTIQYRLGRLSKPDEQIVFPIAGIRSLEYAEDVRCLAVEGEGTISQVEDPGKQDAIQEHFFFLDQEVEKPILDVLHQQTGLPVRRVAHDDSIAK